MNMEEIVPIGQKGNFGLVDMVSQRDTGEILHLQIKNSFQIPLVGGIKWETWEDFGKMEQ